MNDKELRERVADQLRDEILRTWGLDMNQYSAHVHGEVGGMLLVEFTRTLNQARIEIYDVHVDDNGTLLQWGIPSLL